LANDGEIMQLKTATCSSEWCNATMLQGVARGTLIIALLMFGSCRNNSVGPLISPGSRNYSWTMDTIRTEFNILTGFWGSSPNDVWAGGGGGTPDNYLWHFDGTKWIAWLQYHPQRPWSTAMAIFGFATNDVWMGGQAFSDPGAGLAHWNGTEWGEYYHYEVQGATVVKINDIWGDRPNNVYAMGTALYPDSTNTSCGFILHYNGLTWQQVLKGDRGPQYHFLRMTGAGGVVYLTEWREDLNDPPRVTESLYQLQGNQLMRIFSDSEDHVGMLVMTSINESPYVTMAAPPNSKIYMYSVGSLIEPFHIDSPKFEYLIGGRSNEDAFMSMSDGLGHFNGTDYAYLYTWARNSLSIQRRAVFDKEVFFTLLQVSSVTHSLILHGRLNQ
jgi:hypothetical protein